MIKFSRYYFLFSILLFLTEILIALYAHDQIIRPYVGDFLVVILLYCLAKSFLDLPTRLAAFGVLLFSYLIEALQYLNLVEHLGLKDSKLANTIIGNYFTWIDILAYTLGIFLVVIVEKFRDNYSARIKKGNDDRLHHFI
ncbi:MAG: DUF2809 domain-containing protein [Sphingobacteriaceae bacterium]|nr:DUF2809 domain-containing protein [Sphingobacteriaceae bacterium]